MERSWIPDTWRAAVACGLAIGVLAALVWGGLDVATGGPAFLDSLPGHLAVTFAASMVVCLFGYGAGAGSKPVPRPSLSLGQVSESPYAGRVVTQSDLDELVAFRDRFLARTRVGAAFSYALLAIMAVAGSAMFAARLADASSRDRLVGIAVFAAVFAVLCAALRWNLRHPFSPERSRRVQMATVVIVVAVAVGDPDVPGVIAWGFVSSAGIVGLAGFALGRRRLRRDITVVAAARAQGWSADRPYADYLAGFRRRPRRTR